MKTHDEHETLLALSAQIKNGIEKGIATPNGKVIESINKVFASYNQVSKALCNKENATLDEVLRAVSQVKAELEAVKRERDAARLDMKRSCNICKHAAKSFQDEPCNVCAIDTRYLLFEWRGVCPENMEVQDDG